MDAGKVNTIRHYKISSCQSHFIWVSGASLAIDLKVAFIDRPGSPQMIQMIQKLT